MNFYRGRVVWLTGFSGSGKSTLCKCLATELEQRMFKVHVLDGDEVRKNISSDLGFSITDRFENIRRITRIAKRLSEYGTIVLVAVICPLEAMREVIRLEIPNLIEVFLDVPLNVCETRDP